MAISRITKTVAKKLAPKTRKKQTIKVNSNPNKTRAKGERNPTKTMLDRDEMFDPVYDKYGYPSKEVIKIKEKENQELNKFERIVELEDDLSFMCSMFAREVFTKEQDERIWNIIKSLKGEKK